MGLTIVIQQRREARLATALRSAQNLNDEAIREALDQPIDWQPAGPQTLSSVLIHIKRRAGGTVKGILWNGVPIYVDPVGLQEAEVTMNTPVTVPPTAGAPAKVILERALAQLKLDYVVKDGLLTVTSKEAADKPIDANNSR